MNAQEGQGGTDTDKYLIEFRWPSAFGPLQNEPQLSHAMRHTI